MLKWYTNTSFHKWWVANVWKPSWTRFVTAIYGLPAAAVVAGEQISSWANDHTISAYLAQMNVPNWVPSMLAAVALITYIAHGR